MMGTLWTNFQSTYMFPRLIGVKLIEGEKVKKEAKPPLNIVVYNIEN